ncbi:PqqD family protein [Xylanibacter muris]|uniref:PqqD family protein n=1 Tax=Xylanibacter muris TaxID=2736290 RepID=A0ABX2AM97_9BACT|nr:PqqD family protein [Xylanibacter muris]NPD92314.1 PqqD family protein [Xylanibacter muris]
MRIKKGFKLRNICGEMIIVAEGSENIDFSRIISMNESSAFLWHAVENKECFDAATLSELLQEEYKIEKATADIDAKDIIQLWLKAGIIE